MLPAFLIVFRETLEAALVVSIVLTLLGKTNRSLFRLFVWRGILAGMLLSVIVAQLIDLFLGEFEGVKEALFEAFLLFVTAGFITWMILWVHRQKNVAKSITKKVTSHLQKGYALGIFFLVCFSVFREGTETVLYLKASSLVGGSYQLAGAMLGLLGAGGVGLILYRWSSKVNISVLFTGTSMFLLLFAGGLVSHGVHELQEIHLLPLFSFDPVFNISHVLDTQSVVGSFLAALFGYTSKPTLLELISYAGYLMLIFWLERFTDKILPKRTRLS